MRKEGRTGSEKHEKSEFERRFSVLYLPEVIAQDPFVYDSDEIEQGYLPDGLRLRKSTKRDGTTTYFATRKTVVGSDGMERKEKEKEISGKAFKRLWKNTKNARVYKTRYYLPIPGMDLNLELDVFKGVDIDGEMITEGIEGRMLAEIESKTDRKIIVDFDPSIFPFLGPEVTDSISNRKIANRQVEVPAPQSPIS